MTNRRFSLYFVVCAFVLSLTTACARASAPYELRIENASGDRLRTFSHQQQTFALGEMGERYNLRVINHSGERVEAVVTVDGRDVLSGRPGDFRNERGYLVEPYGEVLIEGFRQSLSEVAAFRFTTPGDSYSSRIGSPENVGVIGLAVFNEARPPRVHVAPPVPYDYRDSYDDSAHGASGAANEAPRASRSESAEGLGSASGARDKSSADVRNQAPAAASAPERRERKSNIGTEYGESRYSAVHETSFQRARPARPNFVTTLRYDDRSGLIARGIEVDPPRPRPAPAPSAFPLSRFAPPPPESTWR